MSKPLAAMVPLAIAVTIALTVCIRLAQAQAGTVAEVPPADYSFGQHITFHLKARAPVTITQANLHYRVQGQDGRVSIPVSFEPAPEVEVHQTLSLAEHYIPPFATLTYWWSIKDQRGKEDTSEEKLLYYADNRYAWQYLPQEYNEVLWEIFWEQGDVVFAQDALNIAVEALDEIYHELRVAVPGVIRIFIYPSEEDLSSALSLTGYSWAGGQARPELGVILVGIADSFAARGEMERLIPHELTHLLVYEAVEREADRVPPWLNEGLASLHERHPDPEREALVEQARQEGHLFPLEMLCSPFPADEGAARLAYAQSASVVYYIREKHGSAGIRRLLAEYADNASCEAGVSLALKTSLKGLESAWLGHLTRRGQFSVVLQDSGVWLALWLMTALLALPLLGVIRGRHR